MGLRGPGAKRRGAEAAVIVATRRRFPWQKKGLSRVERVVAFIEHLEITSGEHAGRKMVLRPWQREIIDAIYGRQTAEGRRRVRTAVLSVARKNGKSAFAAGLALCHLLGPESERRGQVYSAAADRDQAALIFNEMVAFIDAEPRFAERVNIQRFAKVIEDLPTGSIYKALSADANTKHGFSASFIIYDELAQAPNRHLYDVLTTSTAARAEPLTVVISTQSADDLHVMSELVDYGLQVQSGAVDDASFHLTLYEAPDGCDLLDEAAWRLANPALGDFRSLDELRTAAQQASRLPAREPAFRNPYLNQRIDAAEHFIPPAEWLACNGPVDPEALRGRPCFGGLDLGSTRDLTSLALIFPDDGGAVLSWNWCPAERLPEREDVDRVPYRTWAKEGLIEPAGAKATDKRAVVTRLAEITAAYDVRAIAFDRWQIKELERLMAEEGITLPLREFGQGFKDMGPAVSALEERILNRRLRHGGNPLLLWAISNVRISSDAAGNRKMDKDRARDRIDPAVALAMAAGIAAREPEVREYELEGPMWV